MKTNKLLAAVLLIGGLFTMNGQATSINSLNLTSFGYTAGSAGHSSVYFGTNTGKLATNSSMSNCYIGYEAGAKSTGSNNVFMGSYTGAENTIGSSNVFIGTSCGGSNTTGRFNTFVGDNSGGGSTGMHNLYLGYNSGPDATSGGYNVFLGNQAGGGCVSGAYNVAIGYQAKSSNGTYNIAIGNAAGQNNSGSNNIFLGKSAGTNSSGSNLLFIENSSNITTPLIWGDFANDLVKLNAKVGVGGVTTFPATVGGVTLTNYKLFVKGGILAEEVRVNTSWADYVFEDSYALPTLNEVECFIDENGHLPNVPSAKQVAEEGISVGEIAKIQQEKIEELTLYIIEQDKQLKEQQKELNELKALVQGLIEKKQ